MVEKWRTAYTWKCRHCSFIKTVDGERIQYWHFCQLTTTKRAPYGPADCPYGRQAKWRKVKVKRRLWFDSKTSDIRDD